jgi:hypothetical protein
VGIIVVDSSALITLACAGVTTAARSGSAKKRRRPHATQKRLGLRRAL